MKRKILLLMMTALLSVGAWATTENVWEGSQAIGWFDNDIHVLTTNFKNCYSKIRKGDNIVVTVTMTGDYSNSIQVLKSDGTGWFVNGALTDVVTNYASSETPTKIVFPVTDAILEALAVETSWGDHQLFFYGNGETVTSVDVEYNNGKANLYYNESGDIRRYYGGRLLTPNLFAAASVGDIVTIDISRVGNDKDPAEVSEWGENVTIYNKCPMSAWNSETNSNEDPEGLAELTTLKVFTAPTTLSLVLTEELLANAKVNGLSLGGGNYNFTSVDLLYNPTVSINAEAGYATFGYGAALDLTDIEAYTAAVSGDKVVLTSVKGKKIPAGTGIILEGSGDVTIPQTTEATEDITGNELLVSDGTVTGDESTIYVLANKTPNGVGFYLLQSGDKLAAGKAYLQVSNSGARQFIGFDDNATGIDNIEHSTPHIKQYYDLQGRRVAQPTKGLYIVNGKRVIIK